MLGPIRPYVPVALAIAAGAQAVLSLLLALLSTDNPLQAAAFLICGGGLSAAFGALSILVTNSESAAIARSQDSQNIRAMTRANMDLIKLLSEGVRDPHADA